MYLLVEKSKCLRAHNFCKDAILFDTWKYHSSLELQETQCCVTRGTTVFATAIWVTRTWMAESNKVCAVINFKVVS
jgi:hypothetical protein